MSDFGKECAKEWRSIKKIYETTNSGGATDKAVREQIVTDMNKNIERHENPPPPAKPWPIRPHTEPDVAPELSDRKNAEWLRDRARLLPDIAKVWVQAAEELLAAAREEGRLEGRTFEK